MTAVEGARGDARHRAWFRRPSRREGSWIAALGVGAAFLGFVFAARAFAWQGGPIAQLVALQPWWTLGAVALAVVALARVATSRSGWPGLPAVAAGALAALGVSWLAPLYQADAAGGDTVLTIATANLRFGLADPDEVVAMVIEHEVDVISLQEVTPEAADALRDAGIDAAMPYSEVHAGASYRGTAVWSRYPLADGSLVPELSFNTVRAVVDTPVGDVVFYAVHPPRPEFEESRRWDEQTGMLLDAAATETLPVVVAGDFNATPDHGPMREFSGLGFSNAVDESGAGFLPTYPEGTKTPYPVVAIDHVLARDLGLVATGVTTVSIDRTDHRAVVVTYGEENARP